MYLIISNLKIHAILFLFVLADISSAPHLVGLTCYRDNVQDEWLVVYILLALTQKYRDFVIRLVWRLQPSLL